MAKYKKTSQGVASILGKDTTFAIYEEGELIDDTGEPADFEPVRIGVVRELTKSDLAHLAKSESDLLRSQVLEMMRHSADRPAQRFNKLAKFLDLILEPDKAESTIGNLAELYGRRLRADPSHAQRWLVAQVGWIVFGRAMDVFHRFMRARAGR